ncbi:MAG: hypothetical protein E7H06_03040 [Enterobacter asburiae]|uniref:hypothetical protein n=1 Tax=Enterobacter asburiae TaxID=61645 RepID=UPI00178C90FD|nr:hypothetical protein [Enterobacter asburiae]MDU3926039.1 hypothetical protein [Enterobacter asburiae]MEA1020173.1 hypothetical protein [Enterobacter asburiae]
MYKNEPLLIIEKESDAFLLSGKFYDSEGQVNLELKRNEWVCSSKVWDVEVVGPRIKIKEGRKGVRLVIKVDAPEKLMIEKFDMLVHGVRIVGDVNKLRVGNLTLGGGKVSGCEIGFKIG